MLDCKYFVFLPPLQCELSRILEVAFVKGILDFQLSSSLHDFLFLFFFISFKKLIFSPGRYAIHFDIVDFGIVSFIIVIFINSVEEADFSWGLRVLEWQIRKPIFFFGIDRFLFYLGLQQLCFPIFLTADYSLLEARGSSEYFFEELIHFGGLLELSDIIIECLKYYVD